MLRSLRRRLAVTSALWSALALIATGIILVSAYQQSLQGRFDQTLDIYLKALVVQLADRPPDKRFDSPAPHLGEPRFGLPLSGWYWVIYRMPDAAVLLTSASLEGDVLSPEIDPTSLGSGAGTTKGPAGETLRYDARTIRFPNSPPTVFLVAADPAAVEADTARFRRTVVVFLGLFAIGLVIAILVQVQLGLQPLQRLRVQLREIRAGSRQRLEGTFVSELEPITDEFNRLIESNEAVLERARRHVGNLAHALKTPISILQNESRTDSMLPAALVDEQVRIMQRQVRHHLERAQIAARRRLIGQLTDVESVVARLKRVIERLTVDRDVTISSHVPAGLLFAGEAQDLEEMVGNLLDNATKWACSQVRVSGSADVGEWPTLRIAVEDDGPGLSAEQSASVLTRGVRLDESKPGSGLGLSIVSELAELYGGRLALDRSPLGGVRAVLELPRG